VWSSGADWVGRRARPVFVRDAGEANAFSKPSR
jgi:hypothetical protein